MLEAASALGDLALLMAREWEGRGGSLLRPVQLPLPEPGAVPQPSRSMVTITTHMLLQQALRTI